MLLIIAGFLCSPLTGGEGGGKERAKKKMRKNVCDGQVHFVALCSIKVTFVHLFPDA